MIKVLVSSCLLGERVRYDGQASARPAGVLGRWLAEGRVVPACPESAAGLPVPRPPAEIAGGDGATVLLGRARITDSTGADVTAAFLRGARVTCARAAAEGVRVAVLKDGSPSCGTSYVYDGSFQGRRGPGQGLAAVLLARAGITLFSERQLERADACVAALEAEAM